jgi:hypothetical protein
MSELGQTLAIQNESHEESFGGIVRIVEFRMFGLAVTFI